MAMFDGKEPGIELTPDLARKKVRKFNSNRSPSLVSKKLETKAHYFSRAVLEKLLSDPSNMGVRFYTGHNDKSDLDNFIVAVNADGENVFKGNFTVNGDKDMPSSGSGIYGSSNPCPSHCPTEATNFA